MRESSLLTADAAINLTLGLGLLLFPTPLAETLGIPIPTAPFYACIFGVVAGLIQGKGGTKHERA